MTRYASKTSVASGRSRSEIENTLARYGASAFMYAGSLEQAMIIFEADGRRIKLVLPLPSLSEFEISPAGRKRATKEALRAHDQAVRQRWRALALVVKAKLEAVESGVATFEQEFMAYTLLPGKSGVTVGDLALPDVAEAYRTGTMKPLLLLN